MARANRLISLLNGGACRRREFAIRQSGFVFLLDIVLAAFDLLHDRRGSLWGLMTVVGPILLIAVMTWAMLRNRTRTPAEKERSEQAARELYEESES